MQLFLTVGLRLQVDEEGETDMCQTISGIRENARVEGKVEGIKV